ncbi:tetratricopeptide repeat protein [Candidatus Pelagibacter sp.]|nr:tetratricopeptide repeat protein [Candidatus Pelagibacter sp.]
MNTNKNLKIGETFNLAIENHQKNKLEIAQDLYNQVLKIDPNHSDANNNLGVLLQSSGDAQKAKDCYEKAIKINTNHVNAHNNLGVIFKDLGQHQKAKDCYEKAIVINPKYADAHNNLGAIYKVLEENQKAKECYEKAIKIDPNHVNAHNNLGVVFQESGENQKAKGCYEKVIEINPSYVEAYNNLGVVLHNLGKFSEAIDNYKQAIKLKPNYVRARINLDRSTKALVPPWHLPMMNDKFRNAKYLEAIKFAIKDLDDDSLILDIGTGSGLLSMMAAANGAGEVIACETSNVIADTAKKIIHKNGYKEKITVINKKSTELKIEKDLPRKADLIISEILSAEFVGEGVRTSIFDANKRLLKKNGKMIPESGTIKISLLGNDEEAFNTISVANVSGFDLSEFNSISQSKHAHFLKKKPTLLSNNENAFSINLYNEENLVKEEKIIELKVNKEGLCLGIIQWMKIQLYKDIEYENSPSGYLDSSTGWPTPIYLFDKAVSVKKGDVLKIRAFLGMDNLWFFKE